MQAVRVRQAGDAALVLEWPAQLDARINAQAVAARSWLLGRCADTIRDAVVGYHTLTVYFDPLTTDASTLELRLREAADAAGDQPSFTGALIDLPVCYGGALGPDLTDVAKTIGASEAEVVRLHTSREYRVFVVGFVPGFAYMGPVAPELALPRRATPRTKVPAGSVAIAAGQTGIYPMETPGGWHLIGRTVVRPFDESRAEPVLFRPGDRVRFRAVSVEEYERAASW